MSSKSDLVAVLGGLVDKIGEEGVSRLVEELEGHAKDSDKGWQNALLTGLASGVKKEGARGLSDAFLQLKIQVQGRKLANLKFMSYRDRAKLVSELQKIDIRRRKKIQSYLKLAFSILKKVIISIL